MPASKDDKNKEPIITATELANYVVCPEAWRLKNLGHNQKVDQTRQDQSKQLRQNWLTQHEDYAKLRYYAKHVYVLMLLIVIILLLIDTKLGAQRGLGKKNQSVSTPK